MTGKLYLVTREDLPPGSQAVQATHAAIQFVHDHPGAETDWYSSSNTIAFLSVPDEARLCELLRRAEWIGIRTSAFREPDLGGSLTAAAFEPGRASARLLSKLVPALRTCRPVARTVRHE